MSIRLLKLVILIAIAACRPQSSSDLKHDVGRSLNDTSSFQWRLVNEEEFFDAVNEYPDIDRTFLLATI